MHFFTIHITLKLDSLLEIRRIPNAIFYCTKMNADHWILNSGHVGKPSKYLYAMQEFFMSTLEI